LNCFKTNLKANPFPLPEEEKLAPEVKLRLVAAPEMNSDLTAADGDESRIPDFRGLTIREVLKRAKERGLEVKTTGSGWAVHQEPVPGTPIESHRLLSVSFSSND
jgi:hypothetical protein